ncbi:uncharacterized protein LOC135685857 [Rhopilema esculentum]|uniref:uncharacterized protein LOC135685857 n=1 Tax=Rhopilema esculentum TaxID=499914 RepID=UPI0031DD829A
MKSAGARAGARQNQNAEAYQAYFDEKFAELKKEMATKKCIDHLHATIKKQNDKIEMLESKIVMMERHIAQLQNNLDDNEQYNRRLCLRINGLLPVAEGESETSEMCLEKVKNVFKEKELEVDVPDAVIDRAHRIGSPKIVKGKKIHQVIVRFTTWRHRTLVYRARKKCPKYRIKLDLTKRRIDIIQKVTSFLKEKELGFAFADVNCRLSVKIGDVFEHFNSEEDLMDIVRRYDEKSEPESHPKQSNDATADNDFTGDDAAAETTAVSES